EHKWTLRVLDDQLNGIHGLLKGDVDLDGKFDLIANSGQPKGPFHNSVGWLRVPNDPHATLQWDRFLPALHDAPGLSHYMGIGDVNGDGRPDIASAAKGGPQAEPGTGEWFACGRPRPIREKTAGKSISSPITSRVPRTFIPQTSTVTARSISSPRAATGEA
ncbi:MAG: VCBS repeat-containing protein, partial [Planctomycetaceae bacterium]